MISSQTLKELALAILMPGNDLNLYFIVDRAAIEEWPDELWPLDSGAYNAASLFGDSRKPEHAEVAPYLIQFNQPDPLYEYLIEEAEKWPLGMFLASVKDWKQTFSETQSWLWPKRINGERVYFRYYDPRVLTLLVPYCQDIGARLPMSSFEEVFWVNPIQKETHHLKHSDPGPAFSLKNTWLLEPDLEERLTEAHLPYRIMDMLKESDQRFGQLPEPELYQRVVLMLQDATHHNILEIKDLFHFCHLSFMFPGFTGHPGVAEKLAVFKADKKQLFYDLVKSLPISWLTPYRSKEII